MPNQNLLASLRNRDTDANFEAEFRQVALHGNNGALYEPQSN